MKKYTFYQVFWLYTAKMIVYSIRHPCGRVYDILSIVKYLTNETDVEFKKKNIVIGHAQQ